VCFLIIAWWTVRSTSRFCAHIYDKMDLNTSGIYKFTSPSGCVYIGQAVNIHKRKQKYKWVSVTMNQPIVYRSIQKYGWDSHIFDVIEFCDVSQLDDREIYHKQKFIDENGWEKALFCRIHDAQRGGKMEQWVKDKISKSKKGHKPSQESIERKRQSLTRGKQCKPAYQYDKNGCFIKKWEYREDAEREYNDGKRGNNISSCINGKQHTAYGFIWKAE